MRTHGAGRLILPAILIVALGAGTASAISITTTAVATDLTSEIFGPGITLVGGSASLVGAAGQAGTFSGAAGSVGFDKGIVLMTGSVADIPGFNTNGIAPPETVGGLETISDIDTVVGGAGDADLDLIVAPFITFDASVLTFSFTFGDGSGGGDLFFDFVFASEEYIDYIDSGVNDVFGLFVDGVNLAKIGADPISVDTVNHDDNSAFYINNVGNASGLSVAGLDIKFDGLTTVITAKALGLGPGVHTVKFAVADTSDGRLDAGVFIRADSFTDTPGVPEPGTIALFALGGLGLAGHAVRRRRRRSA